MPSLPFELMKTAVPAKEVAPNIWPIKQLLLSFTPNAADTDDVTGGGDTAAGGTAQGDVIAAGGVASERRNTNGRVAAPVVFYERFKTNGRVLVCGDVVLQRADAVGRVAASGGITIERVNTGSRVASRRWCC